MGGGGGVGGGGHENVAPPGSLQNGYKFATGADGEVSSLILGHEQ